MSETDKKKFFKSGNAFVGSGSGQLSMQRGRNTRNIAGYCCNAGLSADGRSSGGGASRGSSGSSGGSRGGSSGGSRGGGSSGGSSTGRGGGGGGSTSDRGG